MASLLDDPPDPDATDYSNPVSAALGDLYRRVTGYMTKQPEMAFRYADNPIGTETTQSVGMPAPTTYAGAVGQYVDPSTGQLTDQGRQRMADNPLLGFDTGGVSPVSGLLGALKGYHGSPHAFDRFSNDAIGTGEGAQAYGYGHYLADAEDVARSYRDALTRDSGAVTYQTPYRDARLDNSSKTYERFLAARFRANGGDVDATAAHLERDLEANPGDPTIIKALELARAPGSALTLKDTNPGHMYEVNVNAEPEHFLDWDKPLSEQHPKVIEALNKTPYPPPDMRMPVKQYLAELETNREMATREGDPAALATQALHEAGIPGIRYLDAGSRGKGEGSRNTVVFDPSTMDIIRRYGVAGLLGGAAAAGSRVGADGRQEQ